MERIKYEIGMYGERVKYNDYCLETFDGFPPLLQKMAFCAENKLSDDAYGMLAPNVPQCC